MRTMKESSTVIVAGLLLIAGTATAGEHRVAFVTSVTGTPDLGSWDDAGGATGLAAGDAICQARAAAGGLANPENFVAWLSSSGDDAYCRIHGLTGKKADDCGQASLPEAAGPWVRTDGYPFAPEIGPLLAPDNAVYTPPRLDEFGAPVNSFRNMLTGTDGEGVSTGANRTCEDWTSTESGDGPTIGSAGSTSRRWTFWGGAGCDYSFAGLMCMERLPGPVLPAFSHPGRTAFVTSAAGNGDLGSWPEADAGTSGIEAGDSICRNLAASAGLPLAPSFKAFLSDDATDAIDRFEHDGSWVRPDGVPVAADKAELISESLFTAITVTETGDYLPSSVLHLVWTGTNPDGTRSNGHCGNWQIGLDAAQGRAGNSTAANAHWTGGNPTNPPWDCNDSFALYCLADAGQEVVFSDRFEQP